MSRFFTFLVLLVLLFLLVLLILPYFLVVPCFFYALRFPTPTQGVVFIGDPPRETLPQAKKQQTGLVWDFHKNNKQVIRIVHVERWDFALSRPPKGQHILRADRMPVSLPDRIGLRQLRATGPRSAPTGCCSWSKSAFGSSSSKDQMRPLFCPALRFWAFYLGSRYPPAAAVFWSLPPASLCDRLQFCGPGGRRPAL